MRLIIEMARNRRGLMTRVIGVRPGFYIHWIKLKKSFSGGPEGGGFSKSPLVAEGTI